MLNWMAIYRRILQLYNVKSQQDLGMALGVPVNFGTEGADTAIPWPILELVVAEKRVSWAWLLTGTGDHGGGDTVRRPAGGQADLPPPPRIETRELERVLLNPEDELNGLAGDAPDSAATGDQSAEAAKSSRVVRTLESIKNRMRKEIERVERLLEEHDE